MQSEAKRLKKNAARTAAAAARQWSLTERMVRVVLMCTLLADGVPDPGVVFLRGQGRRRPTWPYKSDEELAIMVLDRFLTTDVAGVISMCDQATTPDSGALVESTRLVEEWRVSAWAAAANHKGASLATSSVFDEFERRRAALPEELRPPCWGSSSSGASRKKATRWRARFGGRMGVLRPTEIVPADEMKRKASLISTTSQQCCSTLPPHVRGWPCVDVHHPPPREASRRECPCRLEYRHIG